MTIGSKRYIGGTLVWALLLAALVVMSGTLALALRNTPDRAILGVTCLAFLAGACGIYLSGRAISARSNALHDPLTGLPNRVLLEDRIEQALRRSARSGEPFAVVVVDLDGFKNVNDLRGHGTGDAVLRMLARRFEEVLRTSDTVARVGGDEFVVLSLGAGDDEETALLASRLRRALREPFTVNGTTVEIDGSIGWAIHPADGETPAELLERADVQMYATKHDTGADAASFRRGVDAAVIRDVQDAVEQSELVVVYQPILDLQTGEPHGAEALVRRLLPNHTLLPAAEFVPHVERTALVRDITLLVVTDALASQRLWVETGNDLAVSVNIPFRLLDDRIFVDRLAEVMRSFEAPANRLTLEVVPSSVGARSELDQRSLARLSALGVRLSLDDGGRQGSIAALRRIPFDELKIDAALVHGIGKNAVDAAVVHGLVDIGHALGLPVVAEGVETREAWRALAEWGCDYVQGFLVAEPRPAAEVAEWLRGRWPAVA
ncbi:MAG: bifunctional diguanylate cyclase/phosphodiesterase [Gaiellaceae bacterium]